MPQEERLSSVLEAGVWHTYKPIIQKLYIEERKSKRKVKEIMESDYGFPQFTDTTWGDKLLHELRLPKKLKTSDWPVLHEHRRRREAEGKKTDIYLHDMLIPWEKARREIYYRHGAPPESGGTLLPNLIFVNVVWLNTCSYNAPPTRRNVKDTTTTFTRPYLPRLTTVSFNVSLHSGFPHHTKH
ncbi:hypothetical protein GGR51DRAFT_544366 [Nemania sp. FL0031]|nr:hypothetical protein GGR51DRAFT_544366 [Nemania sp. FL0031]